MSDAFKINFNGRSLHYTDEEIESVVHVLKNAPGLTQGNEQKRFEAAFSDYTGLDNCFAFSNAASAIEMTAILSKLGPDDEVIIPAHTYCASAIPFGRTGAKIVWADIDPETLVVSADTLRPLINKKTRFIVVVHLYGLCADMPPIMKLAHEKGIQVLEDCAQALGAKSADKQAGSYGDFAVYSFQSQKNISTMGEGGILHVKDPQLASKVYGLRHNGHQPFPEPREHYWKPAMVNVQEDMESVWPYNFCISEVQCALGVELLKRVDSINKERSKRAEHFREALSTYPELTFQKIPKNCTSAHHLMPARWNGDSLGVSRDAFISHMVEKEAVKVIIQYYPLYRYPLFIQKGHGDANCPNTDAFYDNMVSFPFDLWMSEGELKLLIDAIKNAIEYFRSQSMTAS